jgi:DNA-binding transcriptional LysR family regulator
LPTPHTIYGSDPLSLRIDLIELETFIAVVEQGSFSQAALRMHVSQPSVTARIQRLEERLGVKLIHRTTREVEPTKDGIKLYDQSLQALSGLKKIVSSFDAKANKGSHRLVIAATPMIAATMLPNILNGYQKIYTDVNIHLLDLQYREVIEKVDSGEADLAVIAFDGDSNKLRFQTLADEELLLVVPTEHPLAKLKQVVLEKVLEYPLLILDRYTTLIRVIEEEGKKRNLPVNSLREATQLNTLLALLDAGNGITFLPKSMAQANAKHTRPTLRVTDVTLTRRYGIVVHKKKEASTAALSFIEYIRKEYAKSLGQSTAI